MAEGAGATHTQGVCTPCRSRDRESTSVSPDPLLSPSCKPAIPGMAASSLLLMSYSSLAIASLSFILCLVLPILFSFPSG